MDRSERKQMYFDLELMTKMLVEAEREFSDFSQIVPYEHNPAGVYSPRLVAQLQSIGPQIDGMMKLLCKWFALKPPRDNFPSRLKVLDASGGLSCQCVVLRANWRALWPMSIEKKENDSPFFWMAYNRVKHELPEGVMAGHYEHTIDAMAALYALNNLATFVMDADIRDVAVLHKDRWINKFNAYGINPDKLVLYRWTTEERLRHKYNAALATMTSPSRDHRASNIFFDAMTHSGGVNYQQIPDTG